MRECCHCTVRTGSVHWEIPERMPVAVRRREERGPDLHAPPNGCATVPAGESPTVSNRGTMTTTSNSAVQGADPASGAVGQVDANGDGAPERASNAEVAQWPAML
ncbi:MAG: hypothetical protein NVS2B4_11760 [Ramlibacter sp.]